MRDSRLAGDATEAGSGSGDGLGCICPMRYSFGADDEADGPSDQTPFKRSLCERRSDDWIVSGNRFVRFEAGRQ
jgi:hypothetical protein